MNYFKIDMLVSMSQRYEQSGPFNTGAGGGTADYVFAFMFGMIMMLVTYPFVTSMFPIPPIFARNMVYYVMYIWSKRHPTAQANIWGIPLEAISNPATTIIPKAGSCVGVRNQCRTF